MKHKAYKSLLLAFVTLSATACSNRAISVDAPQRQQAAQTGTIKKSAAEAATEKPVAAQTQAATTTTFPAQTTTGSQNTNTVADTANKIISIIGANVNKGDNKSDPTVCIIGDENPIDATDNSHGSSHDDDHFDNDHDYHVADNHSVSHAVTTSSDDWHTSSGYY